jgi:hypothetical protein
MAIFESQKKSARNLVLSANSQLSGNDVFADIKLTQRQRFDGSAVMEQVQTRRSDKDMSGKGTEFATDSQMTSYDSKFTFKAEGDDWLVGWALAFAMGSESLGVGGPPYVHTIGFDETTTEAKMTNVYLEDTHDVKTKYPDMAISDVTLTIGSRGSIQVEVAMMGTGRYTDVAMATLPTLPTAAYLLNSDAVFSLGPSGSPAAMTGRFISATIKIGTGVVNHTSPGGGLYGIFMRTGLRTFAVDAVIAAKDTDDIRTLFMNDTLAGMTIVVTSGASILNIAMPAFKIKASKLGVDGNMVTWAVSVDQTTACNIGGVEPISAIVTNDSQATAYLVGV